MVDVAYHVLHTLHSLQAPDFPLKGSVIAVTKQLCSKCLRGCRVILNYPEGHNTITCS